MISNNANELSLVQDLTSKSREGARVYGKPHDPQDPFESKRVKLRKNLYVSASLSRRPTFEVTCNFQLQKLILS